jgi:hypothetical protein
MDWLLDGVAIAIAIAAVLFIALRIVSWFLSRD